jgi:1-acyl-sn-glycerol-3-phosphate acyltransferase
MGAGGWTRSVERGWRIVRTALSFAWLGCLSLLLALAVLPVIRLLPGGAEKNQMRSQEAVHWACRFYMLSVRWLRVLKLRLHGVEQLRKPGILVVANHPTLLDAIVLLSLMPQADVVAKGSHFQNPFLAGPAKGAGYIPNWNGPQLVAECAERLKRGRSVIIFPEGTRSPVNQLGPFARGAAHIALRGGCDPVPVTIQCEPATLYRGRAWWDVPERRFTLTLTAQAPLLVADSVDQSMSRSRAARALTASLRDHFERHLVVV